MFLTDSRYTFVTSKKLSISGRQFLGFSGGGENGLYVDPQVGAGVLEFGLNNLLRGALLLSNRPRGTHLRLLDRGWAALRG